MADRHQLRLPRELQHVANGQTFTGAQLCAYDRMAMINHGSSPAAVCFTVSNDGNFLPADLDGATPPADGTPGYFLNFEPTSSLRLYQLSPNFPLPPTHQPEL